MSNDMASGTRVRTGNYTEADVSALYMKYRERGVGSFVREVGDFIAHAKRDRGATLDRIAYLIAQIAFFNTHIRHKQPLMPEGECGWWLKHFLLTKAEETPEADILKNAKMTRNEAKNAVKSWFDRRSAYPSRINCTRPEQLCRLADLFCKKFEVKNVFEIDAVELEIKKIFEFEGIPDNEMEGFIVGTAVLLSGKSVEIVSGVTATISLSADPFSTLHADAEDGVVDPSKVKFGILPPDGPLVLSVLTYSDDDLANVGQSFLETEIDTSGYFSRSFVSFSELGVPSLKLNGPMRFDTSLNPKVEKVV